MDAESEKLIQELMSADEFPVRLNSWSYRDAVEHAIREAISRTQEATRREALLEATQLATYTRPVGWHVTAADLIRMTEAPAKANSPNHPAAKV